MTKPNKPAPTMLPAGSVGRWPLEATGYGENVYEVNPGRPWVDFTDVYGKPVRAKLSCATQDVAVSYFPALPGPGRFSVEVFIPSQNADNPQADYHLNYYERGKLSDLQVTIDQTKYSNEWVSLGVFDLDPRRAQDGQVNITDYNPNGSFMMAFSGVRWVPPLAVVVKPPHEGKTNQDVINAFIVVGAKFNEKFTDLVAAAGLNVIYNDRKAAYSGPTMTALPNLSSDRKNALNETMKMSSDALAKAAVEASKPKVVKGKVDGRIWGVHGSAGAGVPPRGMWDFWINELKQMGMKWYKQCDNGGADYGDGTIFRWVLALRDAGITPVIRYQNPRMFPKRLEPSFWDKMNGYVKEGITWAEIGNEPNLAWEWQDESFVNWHNADCVRTIAEVWLQDAEEAIRRGAKPAWYAFAPTDWQGGTNHLYSGPKFQELCWKYIGTNARDRARNIFKNGGWVAVHVALYEFPFEHDPFNHGVGGGAPWDMCMRGYEIPIRYIQNNIGLTAGVDFPIMSTESGVFTVESPSMDGHKRYESDDVHADLMVKMFDWLETNSPLQAMMPWCIAVDDRIGHKPGEYVQDGWYLERNGQFGSRSVVAKLKQTKQQRG